MAPEPLTRRRIEPFGHEATESKIERVWSSTPDPSTFTRARITRYDPTSALQFGPVEYVIEPLNLRSDSPTEEWTRQNLLTFIRGEFGNHARTIEAAPLMTRPALEESVVGFRFLLDFLERSEAAVYRDPLVVEDTGTAGMAKAIYQLLCQPGFGSLTNQVNNDERSFVDLIEQPIQDRSRLLFVLPGFPFKDQNRFRVPYSACHVDLADISFLTRLHLLTQAVYQVHPHGADVLILSDGSLYAELFGVNQRDCEAYYARLRHYRNLLNLQGTVSILPLSELISRTPKMDSNLPRAQQLTELISNQILTILDKGGDQDLGLAFSTLVRAMKRNMNTRTRYSDLTDDQCWQVVGSDRDSVDRVIRNVWDDFHQSAMHTAVKYAATNLSIKFLDLVQSVFPSSIRGTVHPKPGQFLLAREGALYPWNGVAVVDDDQPQVASVRVQPFRMLAGRRCDAIRLDTDDYPLCYRICE